MIIQQLFFIIDQKRNNDIIDWGSKLESFRLLVCLPYTDLLFSGSTMVNVITK